MERFSGGKWLVILAGPTASGKTRHAIRLARHFNTAVLSADSRQFYRELKIGVASPDPAELKEVPHHFIGHIGIQDYYNASMYEQDVLRLLPVLFSTSEVVILTGGSGLYIDTVVNGIDDLPDVDPELRKNLISKLEQQGIEDLLHELRDRDPEYYRKVDRNNPKRILKALEISIQTGKPYSGFLTRPKKSREFGIIKTGLMPPREELYSIIDNRVDGMISKGLIEEARSLLPFRGINALNTVGYKELFDFFDGTVTFEEAVRLVKRNTRHYAKRQITWFARDPAYHWFLPGQTDELIAHIESLIIR